MDCIFCKIIKGEVPSYTVYEDDDVKCFLDVNPVSNGHTLVIPKHHCLDVNDISEEDLLKIFNTSKKIVKLLQEKLNPDGFTLTQNNGCAQAVKHYHLHVIPKYETKDEKLSVEEVYNKIIK